MECRTSQPDHGVVMATRDEARDLDSSRGVPLGTIPDERREDSIPWKIHYGVARGGD